MGNVVEFPRKIVFLIVKIAVVLLIPYYWIVHSGSTSNSLTLTGTWGISQGTMEIIGPVPIWAINQLLFALMFILPLIAFSYFYKERALDRRCLTAAGVSVFLSFLITFMSSAFTGALFLMIIPSLVVPCVVSLSVFVFVFWPLLRNSWQSIDDDEVIQKESEKPSSSRKVLGMIFPINTATLVWVSMVIFPSIITISSQILGETSVTMNLWMSGGLPTIAYQYQWVRGGGYYPTIFSDLTFGIASTISPQAVLIWSLNLWLGITTLQYVLGKATLKRVRILALVAFLISLIPALLVYINELMHGIGTITIPLPFYPIIMLLVAKFIHAPVPGTNREK